MRKRNQKVISLMLIVVMLLNFLPATATAMASSTNAQMTPGITAVPNPDFVEPGSVRELESRREENVKHFLLPDNTVQAVVYADAVHRKDESGNWQDISNDLSLTEYKGVKFYTTADERVVFAEKFAPNTQLWQLSENGYSIAMGMAQLQLSADATVTPIGGVTVTNAPVRRSATTWHNVEDARVVDNTASIVYSNVKTNTDLEYIMVGNDIKENIVVKSRSNSYTYQFNITLTGLTAVLNENGSISLTDSVTGAQQYIIPAPYMVDAAGEYSDSVTYSLKQTGEGQYALTVTADSRWINAADRAFPVKIDPTLRGPGTFDTYIDSNHPDQTYHDSDWIYLAHHTAAFFLMHVPSLPTSATLMEAKFNVFYYYYDNVTSGFIYAAAYRVDQPWRPYEQTWNAANQRNNLGISPTLLTIDALLGDVNAYSDSPAQASFNITSTVQSWYNGTTNYGIALRYFDGSNSGVILNSMEGAASYRPYLTVTYSEERLADGVYYLQNVGTGLYLDVRGGGYTAGTAVQQYSAAAAGYERNQLFKIAFLETVGGDNYYSVRSMTNSRMGLSSYMMYNSSEVFLESMPPTDFYSADMGDRMWAITSSGSSYTLNNGDSTSGGYLTAPNGTVGIQVRTAQSITNNSKWNLIPYTGPALYGAFITNSSLEVVVGSQIQLNVVGYSSTVGVNGPATFEVYGTNGELTDKATIDANTGVLTGIITGTVSVKFTYLGCPYQYYRDVGIKTSTCTNVFLDVSYDEAYKQRYENYEERIRGQLYELREKFINEFDIWIRFGSLWQFDCIACACPNKNADGECQCVSPDLCQNPTANDDGTVSMPTSHHTNYSNIVLHGANHNKAEYFVVRYFYHPNTCRRMKVVENGVQVERHVDFGAGGVSFEDVGVIAVSVAKDDSWLEKATLAHEFGHLYGTVDHYDGENIYGDTLSTSEIIQQTEDNRYNERCIYGEKNDVWGVYNISRMCDGCKAQIMSKRTTHNHGS